MHHPISKILLAGAVALACGAASARDRLSIMFAAQWDPAAVAVAQQNLGPKDLLSKKLANGRAGTFTLPASVDQVSRDSRQPCSTAGGDDVVMYDPEPWDHTPPHERNDLVKAINDAAREVEGSGCRKLGLAPAGEFMGIGKGACQAVPGPLSSQVDWRRVRFVVLQSQRLLSDRCGGPRNVAAYSSFVNAWARNVKQANPSIKVYTSMTFRYTDPETMKQAVRSTGRFVDGYYLAYPSGEGGTPCRFCSASALKSVIDEIRVH